MQKLARYRYEFIAGFIGAIVMVLELIGSRMIAPYFGTSMYVWTAVIGVILGSLSVGYYYGGRLADQDAKDRYLALIILLAALLLLTSLVVQKPVLQSLSSVNFDLRLTAFAAALLLFGPVNVFLGMVSPYVAKLKLTSLKSAGRSVGRLYAAGTAGSIIGTFAAGYWLIAFFGNRVLSFCLVGALILVSLLASRRELLWQRTLFLLAVGIMYFAVSSGVHQTTRLIDDVDTAYTRYIVEEHPYKNRPSRWLTDDNSTIQSLVYLDKPSELASAYAQRFMDAAQAIPNIKRVLVIGGGGYVFPQAFASQYPNAQIDVVEIDPKLPALAQKYFFYTQPANVHEIAQDGRTYLNAADAQYDLIYMDAFSSFSPPFQLTTAEAVSRIHTLLTPNGATVINIVGSDVDNSFSGAETTTYAAQFPFVRLYPAVANLPADLRQNLILVATKSEAVTSSVSHAMPSPPLAHPPTGQLLTDDYAPVERLIQ